MDHFFCLYFFLFSWIKNTNYSIALLYLIAARLLLIQRNTTKPTSISCTELYFLSLLKVVQLWSKSKYNEENTVSSEYMISRSSNLNETYNWKSKPIMICKNSPTPSPFYPWKSYSLNYFLRNRFQIVQRDSYSVGLPIVSNFNQWRDLPFAFVTFK